MKPNLRNFSRAVLFIQVDMRRQLGSVDPIDQYAENRSEGALVMRKHLLSLTIALLGTAIPCAASAASVTSVDPQTMVTALQNAGYKAVLGKSDDGEPVIDTAAESNAIRIIMTECKNKAGCKTTEFAGVWDCSSSIEACKQAADAYNNE